MKTKEHFIVTKESIKKTAPGLARRSGSLGKAIIMQPIRQVVNEATPVNDKNVRIVVSTASLVNSTVGITSVSNVYRTKINKYNTNQATGTIVHPKPNRGPEKSYKASKGIPKNKDKVQRLSIKMKWDNVKNRYGGSYAGKNFTEQTINRIRGKNLLTVNQNRVVTNALNRTYYKIPDNFNGNITMQQTTFSRGYKNKVKIMKKNSPVKYKSTPLIKVWDKKNQTFLYKEKWKFKDSVNYNDKLLKLNEKIKYKNNNSLLNEKFNAYYKKTFSLKGKTLKGKNFNSLSVKDLEEYGKQLTLSLKYAKNPTEIANINEKIAVNNEAILHKKRENSLKGVKAQRGKYKKRIKKSFTQFTFAVLGSSEELKTIREFQRYTKMSKSAIKGIKVTGKLSTTTVTKSTKLALKGYTKIGAPGTNKINAATKLFNKVQTKKRGVLDSVNEKLVKQPKSAIKKTTKGLKNQLTRGIKFIGRNTIMRIPGAKTASKLIGGTLKGVAKVGRGVTKIATAPFRLLSGIKKHLIKLLSMVGGGFAALYLLLFLIVIIVMAFSSLLNYIFGGGKDIKLQDVAQEIISQCDEARQDMEDDYKNNFADSFNNAYFVKGVDEQALNPDDINISYWTSVSYGNKNKPNEIGQVNISNLQGCVQLTDLVDIGNYKSILTSADAYFNGSFNFNEGAIDWLKGNTSVLNDYVDDRYNDSHQAYLTEQSAQVTYRDDACRSFQYSCNNITDENKKTLNRIRRSGQHAVITNTTDNSTLEINDQYADEHFNGCEEMDHEPGSDKCDTNIKVKIDEKITDFKPTDNTNKPIKSIRLTYNDSKKAWGYDNNRGETSYIKLKYNAPQTKEQAINNLPGTEKPLLGEHIRNNTITLVRDGVTNNFTSSEMRVLVCYCRTCPGHTVQYCNGHMDNANVKIFVKNMDEKSVYSNASKQIMYDTDTAGLSINYFKSDKSSGNSNAYEKYNKLGTKDFDWMNSSSDNDYSLGISRYNVDWAKEYGIRAVLTTVQTKAEEEAVKSYGDDLIKELKKNTEMNRKKFIGILDDLNIPTSLTAEMDVSNTAKMKEDHINTISNPIKGDMFMRRILRSGSPSLVTYEMGIVGDNELIVLESGTAGSVPSDNFKIKKEEFTEIPQSKAYPDGITINYTYYRIIEVTSGNVISGIGYLYPLPEWHTITAEFWESVYHVTPHNGTDIAAPSGTPIMAMTDGIVHLSNFNSARGYQVVIAHTTDSYWSRYQHMSSCAVKTGDIVSRGQIIGYVGSTGQSTGPHLHLELGTSSQFESLTAATAGGYLLNAMDYLPSSPEEVQAQKDGTYINSHFEGQNVTVLKTSKDADKNAITIWSYLQKKGFSDYAIAGILGNWYQESNWQPGAVEKKDSSKYTDDQKGHGLMQWTADRWYGPNGLKQFASKKGKSWDDLGVQLDFFVWEMENVNGSYIGTKALYQKSFNSFKKYSSSVKAATSDFFLAAEGAGDSSLTNRQGYATHAWNLAKKNNLLR